MILNLKKHPILICLLVATSITAKAKDTVATSSLLNTTSQNTIIEIKDADKIFKQKEKIWWDENSNSVLGLITIIVASITSLVAVKWQTNIAKRQLQIMKEQIDETSKTALDTVRANNISAARIDWIKELRPLMAILISDSEIISQDLKQFNKLDKKRIKNADATIDEEYFEFRDKLINLAEKLDRTWHQIKLYLNTNEKVHRHLIESYDLYTENFEKIMSDKIIEKEVTIDELANYSRAVLKTAWEQAKNIN